MTPDKELEVIAFRESVKGCPYDDLVGKNREMLLFLCDSALRLAAIEAAGDEEVDRACDGLMKSYRSLDDSLFHRSMNALDDIAKSRNATTADLRAKLGEAEKRIEDLEETIDGLATGETPVGWLMMQREDEPESEVGSE